MATTTKEERPTRMMCCNCSALVYRNEEYCDLCKSLRKTIADAAIEKTQAIDAAANAEERITIATRKLAKIKERQNRVHGMYEKRN